MTISISPGRNWYPLGTQRCYDRPEVGQLLAYKHSVWRVANVDDVLLDDADREVWLKDGMPDLETWRNRPYRIGLDWIGGARPPWAKDDSDDRKHGTLNIPAGAYSVWNVYPKGRWPQCSCCGEPMPCRAELEDEQVSIGLNRIAELEAIPPGACWACSEPITTRQKSVTYLGENLDLPGGRQPHFHMRGKCRGSAHRYEERWLAADPRRERILTWPKCAGILVVHADGSSECVSDRDPIGGQRESQPDCHGHLTHDHSAQTACYAHGNYLSPRDWDSACCPRGCKRSEHQGLRAQTPRPERRQPSGGGLSR